MSTSTASNPMGLKRICINCGARFYDMNKRPILCPSCKIEFTIENKLKSRRGKIKDDKPGKESPVADAKNVEKDDPIEDNDENEDGSENANENEEDIEDEEEDDGVEVVSLEDAEKPSSINDDDAEADPSKLDDDTLDDIPDFDDDDLDEDLDDDDNTLLEKDDD